MTSASRPMTPKQRQALRFGANLPKFSQRRPIQKIAWPLMRAIMQAIDDSGLRLQDIADRAGVSVSRIKAWRGGKQAPTLTSLEAVLEVVEHRIVIEPVDDAEIVRATAAYQRGYRAGYMAGLRAARHSKKIPAPGPGTTGPDQDACPPRQPAREPR